jgi:repressor LexA
MGQRTEEPTEPLPRFHSGQVTPRQVQLLSTIAGFQTSRGYSPTIGELAGRLGISRTTAFEHIEQLRRKGLVSHLPKVARSLSSTSKARKLLKQIADERPDGSEESAGGIPLVGRVAAGLPVEAIENKEYISIESCFGNRGDIFALEVRGDSMIGENIHDGDYVICRRTAAATDGQLVVAIVDDENATLKRFYREKTGARLVAANDDYEPIYSNNCRIEGVVIGLVRKF